MKKSVLILLLLAIIPLFAELDSSNCVNYDGLIKYPRGRFWASWICVTWNHNKNYDINTIWESIGYLHLYLSYIRSGSDDDAFLMRAYNYKGGSIDDYAIFRKRVEEGATYENVIAF